MIAELARRFGSQCVVVGVDSQRVGKNWQVYQYTGDTKRITRTPRTTKEWIVAAQELGAGDIVLNCMSQDGVRDGYDIEQLAAIQDSCNVPLVASGGAGNMQDFVEVFEQAHVSAALATSVFHSGEIAIPDLKRYLHRAGIEVRL